MANAGAWPLVGRDDELAWLAAARAQDVGGVVLAGPPGVGKTRLASEFLRSAEDDGAGVFRTSVTSSVAPAT